LRNVERIAELAAKEHKERREAKEFFEFFELFGGNSRVLQVALQIGDFKLCLSGAAGCA